MKIYINIKYWILSWMFVLLGFVNVTFAQTADLITHQPSASPPSGATFEWHNALPVSVSNLVASPTAVIPGLYYGVYNFGTCYSEAAPIRIATNICPVAIIDLNSFVETTGTPSGMTLTFHNASPVSDANRLSGNAISAAAAAGTYYVAYRDNTVGCYSTESVIVVVNSSCLAVILAVSDSPSVLPGTNTPSVVANDTVNGLQAIIGTALGHVTLTSTPNGPLTMNLVTGSIAVAANTPAGSYPISYTICEVSNPANCSTVTTNVTVTAPVIAAVTDSPSVLSGTNTLSVIGNDTVNGLQAIIGTAPGQVTLTSTPNGPLTMNVATGTIAVAANTPAGSYPITYKICEVSNPTNCSSVTTNVTVTAPVIAAVTETTPAINGNTGGSTTSLTSNDTLNGLAATIGTAPGNVKMTTGTLPAGITVNTAIGIVTVAANTLAGNYPISYTICEVTNPSNCSTATATVAVTAPASAPTAITGATTICNGTSTTLTATGGTMSATCSYQWGSGSTVGSNIIAAQIAASITVSPTSNIVYWVRRVDTANNNITGGVSQTVSIISSIGGTLSANQNICAGASASDIVLTGNIGNVVKWQKSNDATFTTSTDIANTSKTLLSSAIGLLNATTYYRVVVANGSCSSVLSTTLGIIVVPASVGGTISGSTKICSGSNAILLLGGNVGSVIKWQSSAVINFSSNVTDIANTSQTLTTPSLTTTTYYRAIVANGTCSSAISGIATIDIKSLLGSISEISGLTTVCGLTSATYSVAPVANATNYIWTFPSGLSVYTSAGNSVVVNIDALFREGIITVKAVNGCQVSIVKTISITKKPKLSSINGPIATCGITTGTYVATTLAGATYNWTVPIGINITAGQGTSTIQTSYDASYVTGNIGVTATNSCGVSDVLEYKVNNFQMPTGIIGLAQIGTATSGIYITPAVAGMGYLWSVPTGVTIVSGQNTKAVSLSFSSAFTGGTITVAMISSCGTSTPRTFNINRSQPILAIYGPESLCGISQITYDNIGMLIDYTTLFATYAVPVVSDALQYVWTVPQGANIVSGQGTNSIVMSFDNATFVNGNVTVTTMINSGTGTTRSLAVQRVGGTISGTTNVCDLETASYSVPNTIGTNFIWTVPSWMSIVSGQGTNSISVSAGTPYARDTVKVNFLSNCNVYETFLLNVGCVKSTNVNDTQCGTTLLYLNSPIYPNSIVGAQAYKYQVTNATNVRVYESTAPLFNLTQLSGGVTYNTTYSIQIAVKINGVWGGFGSPCTITTPSPITKVQPQFCGTTLATINTLIFSGTLIAVQVYRFEVTDPTNNVRTIDRTTNVLNLTQLIGGVAYNKTYVIRVAVNANGVWGPYGTSCTVTTPEVALTKVKDSQCGTTLLALYSPVSYGAIYGAQAYRFEVTKGTTVVTYDLTNTANSFNLTQLVGGATYATTYSIRVASNVNGTWSAYGASCPITTPAAITKLQATNCGATLVTLTTSIYADALMGVQGYRFEVTNGTNVRTFDATSNLFNLRQLTGGAAYGTTYTIRVAANVNGVWGAYGASCNVTTPVNLAAGPANKTASTDSAVTTIEFKVLAYPNPFTDKFKFELTSASEDTVFIMVFDMSGKMITSQTVATTANINTIELGQEYADGVYNVIVRQGSDTKTLRVIKR